MSYSDLPPLPKSLAAVGLPDGGGSINADTHSTSSSARNLPRGATDSTNRHGSLSSTADSVSSGEASKSPTVSSTGTTSNESNMDTQLATLRQEMHNLRQMDLSLLTQLWALNESIQGFRARLEDNKVSRSPSPPKLFFPQAENDFNNISTTSAKVSVSSTSRTPSQGNQGGRPMSTQSNVRSAAPQLINTNHYPEKAARKPRPKKNLYDYPYEENRVKSDALYQQASSCARGQTSKNIPQLMYTNNDLPNYPMSKAHTLQAVAGAPFHHQYLIPKSHQPQLSHSKLQPVQWTTHPNVQPKTSKGAIPKILSILQRKQRAPPPPPPPPPPLHKSTQRPV